MKTGVPAGVAAGVAGAGMMTGGGSGVGTSTGGVMSGSRVALGVRRETSQSTPTRSADPTATANAPRNSRLVDDVDAR